MRITPLVAAGSVAIVTATLLISCNKSPTSPASPLSPPGDPVASRVEVAGPASVAPGETRQFSATVHFQDGSSRDVSNAVSWQSRAPEVLSVSASGQVTGLRPGDGAIVAFFRAQGALTAMKEVIVVPNGTFRLAGLVTETGLPSVSVVGARLDVVSGTGAGLFTTTGNDGRYRLYGVAGDSQIRVSKDGYDSSVQNVTIENHAIQNFELRLTRARPEVGGHYRLTVVAADACRMDLPEEARVRTYTATLAQQGPQLDATLADATFVTNRLGSGSRFRGTVESTRVTFTLNLTPYYNYYPYYPSYYPDIVEQLSAGYLVMSGSAALVASASGFSGTLDGSLAIWPRDPRAGRQSPTAFCKSASHQFVLTR